MSDVDALLRTAAEAEDRADLRAAIDALEQVVRLVPSHARAWAWLGNVLTDREQFAGAEEAFRRAIEAEPTLAAAYSGLGAALAARGKDRDAEEAYLTSIQLEPTASRYVLLADVRENLGQRLESAEALRLALGLDPDNEEALLNLALISRDDDTMEALKLLKRAYNANPLNPVIARELGFQLAASGETSRAEHYLETARQLNPRDAWSRFYLATLYSTLGREQEALREYQEAAQLSPLSSYFQQQLGRFLEATQLGPAALEAFRRAVSLDSSDAEAAFLLGRALVKQGSLSEGRTWLDRALALDPNHKGARSMQG